MVGLPRVTVRGRVSSCLHLLCRYSLVPLIAPQLSRLGSNDLTNSLADRPNLQWKEYDGERRS